MNTPTPRTDELEGNLIEFCDNQIRFSKMTDHAKTLERELTAVTYRALLIDCCACTGHIDLSPPRPFSNK